MRILIGVCQSQSSDLVISRAAQRTWPAGSSFRLVTVIDTLSKLSKKVEEQLKRQAQIFLNEKIIELELGLGGGFFIDSHIVDGDVAGQIIAESDKWHTDLILVGYQNRCIEDELPPNCVAHRVACRCLCSVEIIKSPVDWRAALEKEREDDEFGKILQTT